MNDYLKLYVNFNLIFQIGGEGGIRTHGPLRRHWFSRPAPYSHSDTSPRLKFLNAKLI